AGLARDRFAILAGSCARRSDDTEATWSEAKDGPSIGSSRTSRQQLGGAGDRIGCRDSLLLSSVLADGDRDQIALASGGHTAPRQEVKRRFDPGHISSLDAVARLGEALRRGRGAGR